MSTTTVKPRLRRGHGAVLVEAWHAIASATPGLSAVELAVLDAICAFHRTMQSHGMAPSLTHERLAARIGCEPGDVQAAVYRLVGRGLVAVQRGGGNTYWPSLPKKLAMQVLTDAADVPPV